MKVVTWNVNSIRSRQERALAWLEKHRPDVLCVQETKVEDEAFPREPFEAAGWHVEAFGEKTYNGVAFIAREPPEAVVRGLPFDREDAQKRVIAGTFDGVRVINVYVPNGQSPESEKFTYKLGWLLNLQDAIAKAHAPDDPVLLLGDFNIAPDDRDVHDPEAWRGKVHFHPREHEALARLTKWGFHDLFRKHHEEGGFYSWWDYRRLGFPKNKGLRIDLALGTKPILERCSACDIDREERKGPKPSDHAPVVTVLD